jgi:GWxTD domain-containing protein
MSRSVIRLTIAALVMSLVQALVPAPGAADTVNRDQELLGDRHARRLGNFSFYGGIGAGSVRGGDARFAPAGRLAFDAGIFWAPRRSFRIGGAFNHFRFEEEDQETGAQIPREVSDITGVLRFETRDGRVLPYASLGAGIYFADNSERADVFRVSAGVEVPVARALLRVEGRYANFGAGAFLGQEGRQSTLGVVVGMRFPIFFGRHRESRQDAVERVIHTLRYVATREEQQEIDGLAGERDVMRYADEFWKRRDPYPELPGNPAREEHETRVAIAASNFGEMGRPGWASERGRVMIVHGQPDEIVWEEKLPRPRARDPYTTNLPADLRTASALELWIYYRSLQGTDGNQSLLLFEEDAVSRFKIIWSNVSGEVGYGRSLPPLPPTILAPISAVTTVY